MKRVLACLLSIVLMALPCMQVYGAEAGLEGSRAETESLAPETEKKETEALETEASETEGTLPGQKEKETTDVSAEPESEPETDQKETESVPEETKEKETKSTESETESEETAGSLSEDQRDTYAFDKKSGGQVRVVIHEGIAMKESVEFTVSLTGTDGNGQREKAIELPESAGDGSMQEVVAVFEGLSEGTYTLQIQAPGFATHRQEIIVNGWASVLDFYIGYLNGFDYGTALHPGALLLGDANGDGLVDKEDQKALVDALDAIKSGGKAADGLITDFNRDKQSDLSDLELFARCYLPEGQTDGYADTRIVPASAISATCGAKTIVTGNLSALLTGEESVTLEAADHGEISGSNPVSMEFEFPEDGAFPVGGILVGAVNENPIAQMEITMDYTAEDGSDQSLSIPMVDGVDFLLEQEEVSVKKDADGVICINLGSQIAVKKVTITITGMKNNNHLAEISKVEFVNNMEDRIPEPQMDVPQNLSAKAGNKSFTASWNPCINVTGYEAMIESEGEQEIQFVQGNSLTVSSFKEDKLVNGQEYIVKVQATNGSWRSGYSSPVTVVPKPGGKPDAPDGVSAVGKYKSIDVSWKDMEDTDSYNLYYRISGAATYEKIEGIEGNRTTISELENRTKYELYVTGVNEFGESAPSLTAAATTEDPDPADMPKFGLLNTGKDGEIGAHIAGVTFRQGGMKESPLDTASGTAWGTVDKNPGSYYSCETWDTGGFNAMGDNHGLFYEFDQEYKMQYFAFQEPAVQTPGYGYVRVRWWDGNGTVSETVSCSIQRKTDAEGRVYYRVRMPQAITAKKIQIGLARSVAKGSTTVSEIYFYHYNSLEDDIFALYTDDLHTVLREDVTQQTIDDLRARINTPDPDCGEYHPDKEALERELKTAEDILNSKLTTPVQLHSGISTNDANLGFGGLNAWQPLGVTAAAGEEITVYVGHPSKKTGDSTNVQLVATQYHAESGSMFRQVANLKIGRNDVTIPKLWSVDAESGGALYVQYTGSNADDRYAVRVSGGVAVPVLDLYQVKDSVERQKRAEAYVTALDSYVAAMEATHETYHQNSGNKTVQYAYQARDCILGASDILSDTMLFSLPAAQIRSGIGTSGDVSARATTLLTSVDAMESMMDLFYQHKGLNEAAKDVKNSYPSRHLNIRYQRMFAGAFMYASGNHIGIEWAETPGMVNCGSLQADADGRYISGRYFGWGIAHEIGHCINQGTYAIAEITNNYYAVLAQAKDDNNSVRFQYDKVYEKVTSETKGRATNVFTQLGMYWQLHLAYDKGYNYKTYADPADQFKNLFFARVDTYARDRKNAPAPGGVALSLSNDRDQDLMRLCCAAAEKNLLEFFERWGMTPNADTIAYAEQFAKETRAIYYVNDNARVYQLKGGSSVLDSSGTKPGVGDGTTATVNPGAANQVDLTLTALDSIPAGDVLGYEIVRCTTSGGKTERALAGFATGGTFQDSITTMNNRVVTYEVTLIDQYLNRSAVKTLAPLKIEHEGNIEKDSWTLTTQDLKDTNVGDIEPGDDDDPCAPAAEESIMKAVDGKTDTVYTGVAGSNAEVLVDFHKTLTVAGIQYRHGTGTSITDYSVSVLSADGQWIEAAAGTFGGGEKETVYFARKGNVAYYDASALKLSIRNQSGKEIAISEFDVLGVTGDNVDFRRTEDQTATIGRLKSEYRFGDGADDVIPKDSIVFAGTYKGNPAYNVVLLYDQEGNIVGGTDADGNLKAYQTILANVPDTGNIEDVSNGTWIYWIEPGDENGLSGLQKVRAELYRVDNAQTNEGQRMVSDSFFEEYPAVLPEIELNGNLPGGN
ncbi:MAG: hypothetical protein HFI63_08565 [Lachnospiraceae bacterium]|nr:hypothetical protein [Lachnospiraceae bacterium]